MAEKEQYVNARNLASRAKVWLSELRPLLRSPWGHPDPRHTAILIIDAQRCFFEHRFGAHLPAAPAIARNLRRLAVDGRAAGASVILTRHAERPGQAPPSMRAFWKSAVEDGTEESEIIPMLASLGLPVVRKGTYDPFHRTALESMLQEAGIRWIVIAGVMTDLCCETAARSAFIRGFYPILVADATATTTESLHLSALRALAHGFAEIGTTSAVLRRLG